MIPLKQIQSLLIASKNALSERYGIKEIGIFGSYVRNEQTDKSDIDILVSFDRPVSLLTLSSAENYLSDILGLHVDIVPKEDVRPELRDEILSSAVYL